MKVPHSYLFSKFRASEFEDLNQALFKVFNFQNNDLHKLYESMGGKFELEGYHEYPINKNIFLSFNDTFQESYDNAFVVGVDIPSIFELNNGVLDKKTIFIVGQDPLRTKNERVENILAGTPYALHLKNCRELLPNTKLYFKLIESLLIQGYRVYLTDVFKVWVSQPDSSKHNVPLREIDRNRFIEVLKAEIEIFKPLTVITWGKVAANTVAGLNLKTDFFNFTHPSGANNRVWQELMGQSATHENKINFWKHKIIEYLENEI